EHDAFGAGHSSTSVSAALGFARARELKHTNESIVAVLGDGALTGGMVLEAMNDAGQSKLPLIVVLNDNDMSISPNVGAMNRYLNVMRASMPYQDFKRRLIRSLDNSRIGKHLGKRMERLKNRIKYFLMPTNVIFEAMGFTYLGPIDGHDIQMLIKVLHKASRMQRPVIIHAITKKGKGYAPAEEDPEKYHGIPSREEREEAQAYPERKSNSKVFGEALVRLAKDNEKIVAVTAAMPAGTGLKPFAKAYPERFFDVGIAEQHAVTMAAGMAAEGLRPVVAIYSTFLQRAYDSILHDVALQHLPVVFAVDRAGLVGADGVTHQGVYDIAYSATFPGIPVYSPATQQELVHMLEYALSREEPAMIRYPRGSLMQMVSQQPVELGKWEELQPIAEITILASGSMVQTAAAAIRQLQAAGIEGLGFVNVRFLQPMDDAMIDLICARAKRILTVEDGLKSCGFGARLALRLREAGANTALRALGVTDAPVAHATVEQQRECCGLTADHIAAAVLQWMEEV
ncbi:MAG: 1-deoxy-D-xylulose-5-phosphate synthase, partial [Eubacteriales bacterium]|nr:1-deoxy-D-xylulose-5-phosphate synthase [Eubacteriales bacterium]